MGIFAFPIVFFAMISFKTEDNMYNLFTTPFTFRNYVAVLFLGVHGDNPWVVFFRPLINSVAVAGSATLITLGISLLAAYSISRFRFWGKDNFSFFVLTLYMVPPIVSLVPLWHIGAQYHLLDTDIYLMWIYAFSGISLSIWLLRSFLVALPEEIEEQAMVDGASRLGSFLRVTMPMLRPGLAVTAILAFIFNWNEYLFSSTFSEVNAITLPVAVSKYGFWLTVDWVTIAALSMLALIPVLVLAFLIQKHIVSGLTLGAVR